MLLRSAWLAAATLAAVPPLAAQQPAASDSITPRMIEEGGKLYRGAGLCAACHGPEGKGGVGPSLADTVWLHSRGTLAEIARQIATGVPQNEAKTGIMMPPKGGSQLTDEQIRLVAAYVWSLTHRAP
jgi:mono/diheme cytochrome c family protein